MAKKFCENCGQEVDADSLNKFGECSDGCSSSDDIFEDDDENFEMVDA